jgi:cytochrome c-type biogenesis protein
MNLSIQAKNRFFATALIVGLFNSSNNIYSSTCHAFSAQSATTRNHSSSFSLIHSSSKIEKLMKPAFARSSSAFHTSNHRSPGTSTTATTTSLSFALEDMIYTAQSTAATLASSSLSSISESTSITSLAVLYFAGLLTSFSPCSLGLLPLTMSYISNAADSRDDKAVFFPTVAFASGLAVVFCTLGLFSSFVGGIFGSGSDNIWGAFVLASLSSGISIAMGLQLLDLVNLPLPSLELAMDQGPGQGSGKRQGGDQENVICTDTVCYSSTIDFDNDGSVMAQSSTSSSQSQSQSQTQSQTLFLDARADSMANAKTSTNDNANSLFRTFLLGGSSALVASPCATPVLTSILGFVAGTQDPALGALLLFIYTVGYSTPLLIVAASGGQALVNLQNANVEEDTFVGKIGQFVNPLSASVLIWYGANGFLEAVFGDPSINGLAPIIQ